ncbi:MAG: anthranilate phosphoribosyltransferase [Candidatus Binatia bacterium]
MRHTFNISTAAMLIAAGAGLRIAKHGNRHVGRGRRHRRAGGARRAHRPEPEQVAACIGEAGVGFLFAQAFHPAMRHVAPVRRELGVRTLFNLLGPLTNPAGGAAPIGRRVRPHLGGAARRGARHLGSRHAMVVHGEDGLDELSLTGPSWVAEWRDARCTAIASPRATSACELCAGRARRRTGGRQCRHPARRPLRAGNAGATTSCALLNAGAALYVGGAVASIAAGIERARAAMASGAATRALGFIRVSSR